MTPSRPSETPTPSRLEAGPEGKQQSTRSEPLPDAGKGQGRTRQDPPSPLPPSIGGKGEGPAPLPAPGMKPRACIRGDEARVLPGRHRDDCPGDCAGCQPCPEPHCQTCRTHHAEVTCPGCLGVARANLGELHDLVADLPEQAREGRQAFHHHHGIPGGDATVMLTPAAPRRPEGSTRRVYAEPGDPRPPLDVLTYWSNRWRAEVQHALSFPATMGNVVSYLDGQLHRIAETHLFTPLARDLARLLHSVENVLRAGDRPDVSRVPCLACGTRLVKVWAEEETRDHWRCRLCGELYDHGRYERAKHEQLASRGADRFVPLADAVAVTGRPEQTVRAWMRQGLIATRRDAGRLQVWWPHVRERHLLTPTRRRR